MKPLVSTITVPFNSRIWLPRLCESFKNQSIWDQLEVMFVDSTSTDGSLDYAQELLPSARCFSGGINSFTNSNNVGVEKSTGKYIMLVNPDMWLEENCIETLVQTLEANPGAGAIVPKVQSYARNKEGKYLIDTVGHALKPSGVVHDRGQGIIDDGQFDDPEEVFGLSGACGIFRREALEEAAWNGPIFDNNFVLYQEDIDLAWRFQHLGWKVLYEPKALAHHNRTVREPASKRLMLSERAKRSVWVNAHSYRNHLAILAAHTSIQHLVRYGYQMIPFELAKATYIAVKEPYSALFTLKSARIFIDAWRKRRHFAKLRRIQPKALVQWATHS